MLFFKGGRLSQRVPPSSTTPREQLSEHALISELHILEKNKWAAKQFFLLISIDKIIQGITTGTVVVVSDGFFKDDIGTSYYIVESQFGTQRIVGSLNIHGHEDRQDAHLDGVYGILLVISLY